MRRGVTVNILAGALEILFGISLIGLIVYISLSSSDFSIGFGILTPILRFFSLFYFESGIGTVIISFYAIYVVLSILTICLIVYGSVTIAFMRREAGEFYKKKKSMTFFLVSSFIFLAYLIVGLILSSVDSSFDIFTFVLTILSCAIVVLRFIGYVAYCKGIKLAPKATEQNKFIPELKEYNNSNVDLVTKLKHLNALKDNGDVSEKEYNEIKKKLIGEDDK